MKTIILTKPGKFRLMEAPHPPPSGPGEALVRVHRIGVCGTDLHAFRGRQPFFTYPRILGHELGVEVVAIGPNEVGLAVGDQCAVEPYLNCGQCGACQRGKPNCCIHLQVLGVHTDGGMREFITVPMAKLHKSTRLSLDQLALVETLCIGAHAVRRAQLTPGEWVLVIGAGPIGLAVIQAAQLAGAKVMVLEINRHRLQFCHQHLLVESGLDGRADPLTQLQTLLSGDLPTVVFEATGNAHSMINAFRYVAHGGKLIFVGLFQGDVTFHDPDFHRRELSLLSSRNAISEDFIWIIRMLETGRINLAPWITHRSALEDIIAEFPQWLEPDNHVIKALIEV